MLSGKHVGAIQTAEFHLEFLRSNFIKMDEANLVKVLMCRSHCRMLIDFALKVSKIFNVR